MFTTISRPDATAPAATAPAQDASQIAQVKTLNSMCSDCAKLGNDCPGTTCQVWTGCIWKVRK